MANLTGLTIYPVKGCRRVELEGSHVERRGLRYDRRWMVVDSTWLFMSQRSNSRLAKLRAVVVNDRMRLSGPDIEPIDLPYGNADGPLADVTVWKNVVTARVAPSKVNNWISEFLDQECSLVFMAEDSIRPVDPNFVAKPDDSVSFADGYPVLLATEASLADLNSRLSSPIPMTRFRPNLVIAGTEPFEEDRWKTVHIGEVRFRVAKACGRCLVTTLDPESGQSTGNEPLKTLGEFRQFDGKANFATNLIPLNPGNISVGEDLVVEEYVLTRT